MKTKQVVTLFATAIMTLSTILTGCSSEGGESDLQSSDGNEASNEVTEVTYWALSTQQENYDPVLEAFNKEHEDIKVNISYYDTDGIKDACKVAASSKTLPNMWFNWGGSLGGFYVENGLTYNLNDLAEEYNWKEKFNENALNLCTYDGVVSGYPSSYDILGVF